LTSKDWVNSCKRMMSPTEKFAILTAPCARRLDGRRARRGSACKRAGFLWRNSLPHQPAGGSVYRPVFRGGSRPGCAAVGQVRHCGQGIRMDKKIMGQQPSLQKGVPHTSYKGEALVTGMRPAPYAADNFTWFVDCQSSGGEWMPSVFMVENLDVMHKMSKTAKHVMKVNALLNALGCVKVYGWTEPQNRFP